MSAWQCFFSLTVQTLIEPFSKPLRNAALQAKMAIGFLCLTGVTIGQLCGQLICLIICRGLSGSLEGAAASSQSSGSGQQHRGGHLACKRHIMCFFDEMSDEH